jgi:hypothetical protein
LSSAFQRPRAIVWLLTVIGKWFVFWAVGVRLFLAGLRQSITPQFTAERIFGMKSKEPLVIVRELGFANLSIGVLGLSTIFRGSWIMPAAIAGGLFYCFAGIGHLMTKNRNRLENSAMFSDLFAFLVLLICFIAAIAH